MIHRSIIQISLFMLPAIYRSTKVTSVVLSLLYIKIKPKYIKPIFNKLFRVYR
jgi:hypothetical protein